MSLSLHGYFRDVNSCLWLVKCCPPAFDAVCQLNLCCAFEGDELAKVFDFLLLAVESRCSSLETATALLVLCFNVVLEMIFVFVTWSCWPCAVVAVVRSSSMVVVCFIELLMRKMSSANVRLERFVSGSCSTSLSYLCSTSLVVVA